MQTIIPEKRERPNRIAVITVFGLCAVTSIGYWVTPETNQPGESIVIAIIWSLLAVLLISLLLILFSSDRFNRYLPIAPFFSTHRLATTLGILFFLTSLVTIFLTHYQQSAIESDLDPIAFGLASVFFILLLGIQLPLERAGFPSTILLISLTGYLILTYFALQSIPFNIDSGEPFSLYYKAIERFNLGLDPYQIYDTANDRPFTALPGFWLIYAPFNLLNMDPRWLGGFAFPVAVALIYWAVPRQRKHLASYCLSLLILMPSLVSGIGYQSGLVCLVIASVIFLSAKKFNFLATAVLGFSFSISLFCWLLAPFYLVYLLRNQSWKFWSIHIVIWGIFTSMLLIPFANMYPDTFLYCTVEYWLENYLWNGISVSYWLVNLIGGYGLQFLQLFIFLILLVQYLKSDKSLPSCCSFIAVFSLFFLAFNRVVEGYFYLPVLICAIAGFTFTTENGQTAAPVRIHRPIKTSTEVNTETNH